jgi:hypothetical protein
MRSLDCVVSVITKPYVKQKKRAMQVGFHAYDIIIF